VTRKLFIPRRYHQYHHVLSGHLPVYYDIIIKHYTSIIVVTVTIVNNVIFVSVAIIIVTIIKINILVTDSLPHL